MTRSGTQKRLSERYCSCMQGELHVWRSHSAARLGRHGSRLSVKQRASFDELILLSARSEEHLLSGDLAKSFPAHRLSLCRLFVDGPVFSSDGGK